MPIRAVTFDADETLWDFSAAMWGGLEAVVAAAERARPEVEGRILPSDLQALRDRLASETDLARETLASVRRRSFRVALEHLGVDDRTLADELAACYYRHRHGELRLFDDVAGALSHIADRYVLGLVTNGNTDPELSGLPGVFAFKLAGDAVGIRKPDPRLFAMAAAAARCRPAELVHIGDQPDKDVVAPQAAGARAVWLDRTGCGTPGRTAPDATITSLVELPSVLEALDADPRAGRGMVGVASHPLPWPDDPRLDPQLLADGDRRNVIDRYRYWRTEAVVADLDTRRHPFHVAIENWQHDLNIGTVVRNANAFLAAAVHIVGNRRWNRRGAMVTDRYQHIEHHRSIEELAAWAKGESVPLVAIDNMAGAVPIDTVDLPLRCVLLFGQEGSGLSEQAHAAAQLVCSIRQFGSTRSINAGVASGIAMHAWTIRHASFE